MLKALIRMALACQGKGTGERLGGTHNAIGNTLPRIYSKRASISNAHRKQFKRVFFIEQLEA